MQTISDWIEHDGKGMPDLPAGTFVQVYCRDEQPGSDENIYDPFTDLVWENWEHAPHLDIVAYRVVQS
jgi:hypothetical protein